MALKDQGSADGNVHSEAEEGSGRGASRSGSEGLPVLDSNRHFSTFDKGTHRKQRVFVKWDRQQCRAFHRAQSYLGVWSQRGYKALFVTVTTAVGGPVEHLSKHFAELLRRVEREFAYPSVEYFKVETNEGNGVIHAILAWRPKDGYQNRPFIIPKDWLHKEWEKIHGAWATSVERVTFHPGSAKGISRYIANQYLVNQEKGGESALVRISGSWRRTFGFPLVRMWKVFKETYGQEPLRVGLYRKWSQFLGGMPVCLLSGIWDAEKARNERGWDLCT